MGIGQEPGACAGGARTLAFCFCGCEKTPLHADGIVCVAPYVPAGIPGGLWEECAGARHVFFGFVLIDLVVQLVAFILDGQHTDAMDATVGGAKRRRGETNVIPGKVKTKGDCEQREEGDGGSAEKARTGGDGSVSWGHGGILHA